MDRSEKRLTREEYKDFIRDDYGWSWNKGSKAFELILMSYTIIPGQSRKEVKYIYGVVSLTPERYSLLQKRDVQVLKLYAEMLEQIKEEMFQHFLKEYPDKTKKVIEFT